MPNPDKAFDDNAPGAWYVDHQCIACGLCENVAPEFFRPAPDYGHYLVYRQPMTPQEQAEAEEARERCPAEAIGNERAPQNDFRRLRSETCNRRG